MSADPIIVELGWPAKQLSPNVSTHPMVLHRFKKAAKNEAYWATRIVRPFDWASDGPFSVHLTAYPPKAWRTGDDDNLVARVKAHLDGIAQALEVNDRLFQAPTVRWADRTERGKLVITIREAA